MVNLYLELVTEGIGFLSKVVNGQIIVPDGFPHDGDEEEGQRKLSGGDHMLDD